MEQLEQLLSSANQVREEFRKNCPFPVVLWVTDDVQRFLVQAAPNLESWATKTYACEMLCTSGRARHSRAIADF